MEKIILNSLPLREIAPGYNAHIIHSNNMTIFHVYIDEGAPLPEHSHINEQVLNLIDGEFELTVQGTKHNLTAGDIFHLLPNVQHSGKALTKCYIIDVFQPVREEYK